MPIPPTSKLADHTWIDLANRSPTVVLPLGACEQHGPHLPLDTDTAVAAEVTRRATSELPEHDVLVAPAQPYAASGEHEGFPGTISIGHAALEQLLIELGRSLSRWAQRLLIVNGHGGNITGLRRAVTQLREESRDVAWWHCSAPSADAHAGTSETTLMMAIRPGSVHPARAQTGRTEPLDELLPTLVRYGVQIVSPSGVLGDPTDSSTEDGQQLLATLAKQLVAAVRRWRVADDGVLHTPTTSTTPP